MGVNKKVIIPSAIKEGETVYINRPIIKRGKRKQMVGEAGSRYKMQGEDTSDTETYKGKV